MQSPKHGKCSGQRLRNVAAACPCLRALLLGILRGKVKLEPIILLPNAWTYVAGRFGIHLFEGELTVSDMDRMEALGNDWYRKNPGKLVELTVIFPSDARMSGEERQRMARLIKRWENDRTAAATVILAAGMVGAMQRSILTGMLMIAPPPHPSKIFGEVPNAITWLLPHLRSLAGADASREALLAAVLDLGAAFQAR